MRTEGREAHRLIKQESMMQLFVQLYRRGVDASGNNLYEE
jgi:hypothetical protein